MPHRILPAHPGGFRCPEASDRLDGVALHVDLAAVLEAMESEVALPEPDRWIAETRRIRRPTMPESAFWGRAGGLRRARVP
jgi:hypothetical protein